MQEDKHFICRTVKANFFSRGLNCSEDFQNTVYGTSDFLSPLFPYLLPFMFLRIAYCDRAANSAIKHLPQDVTGVSLQTQTNTLKVLSMCMQCVLWHNAMCNSWLRKWKVNSGYSQLREKKTFNKMHVNGYKHEHHCSVQHEFRQKPVGCRGKKKVLLILLGRLPAWGKPTCLIPCQIKHCAQHVYQYRSNWAAVKHNMRVIVWKLFQVAAFAFSLSIRENTSQRKLSNCLTFLPLLSE